MFFSKNLIRNVCHLLVFLVIGTLASVLRFCCECVCVCKKIHSAASDVWNIHKLISVVVYRMNLIVSMFSHKVFMWLFLVIKSLCNLLLCVRY